MNKQLNFSRVSGKVLKTYIHISIDVNALIYDVAYTSDTRTLHIKVNIEYHVCKYNGTTV